MNEIKTLDLVYSNRRRLSVPDARIGLIIPSSNRNTEPQFNYYAPNNLGVNVQRIQMTGRHQKPLAALLSDVSAAAAVLADTKPDIIVFHCTGTAMRGGPDGEAQIIEAIEHASGVDAITTAGAVCDALRSLDIRDLVLVTPYIQAVNEEEKHYLSNAGFRVLHDVGLQIATSDDTLKVSPDEWVCLVRKNLRASADGYFLSCTNTSQIEVIYFLESELNKPVVTSNQAVLWSCLRKLNEKGFHFQPSSKLGRLLSIGIWR